MNINILSQGKSVLEKDQYLGSESNTLSQLCKQYKEFCAFFSFHQLIKVPSRVTSHSATLIDHILTNTIKKVSQSGVIDIALSDHQLIKSKLDNHNFVKSRCFKNYTVESFENKLRSANFPNYLNFDNVDIAYSDFIKKLMDVVNVSAPIRERRVKGRTQEWFDGEIADGILKRRKLFKKFKKSQLPIDEQLYKNAKYEVIELVNKKKQEFFEIKLRDNIGKPKELWQTIKSLGLPNKRSSIKKICLKDVKGELKFEPKDNANIFKSFFSNLATDLVSKLTVAPNVFSDLSTEAFYERLGVTRNDFSFCEVDEDYLYKELISIEPHKSSGIDGLSGRFLKDGAKILVSPICQICNIYIKLSVFPRECKIAKLIPLYKKGSQTDPKNYRPISLLPIVSKLIEKIIHQQMQEYLDDKKILYKFQSGFRSNHSTDTCLSYLNDRILKGFDKGLLTGLVAIDLQKAFDTIDHDILLQKLRWLGFSQKVQSWFKSYLSNRLFYVSINGILSEEGSINCGVPQGSILGPLLFLIYVNDMPQAVDSELYLYADDSCLMYQHKDLKVINEKLCDDFSKLCDWFVDNKLSIHFGEDKTKCILFASKNKVKKIGKLNISYKNVIIKQFSKINYLGGLLDQTMSGDIMALNVIRKVNSRLKFLYRKNAFLTPNLRRLLCNALIQPNFDYVCSAWYPNLAQNLKKRLQSSQNKCIRFCLKLDYRSSINFLEFKKINWLPVKQRVFQCIAAHVYNFFSRNCPAYVDDLFIQANQVNCTRHSFLKLHLPQRKTNLGKNTLSYLGPTIWNKIPNSVKDCKLLNSFKHKLKDYFFDQIEREEKDTFVFY